MERQRRALGREIPSAGLGGLSALNCPALETFENGGRPDRSIDHPI